MSRRILSVALCLAVATSIVAAVPLKCPEANGTFPVADQCDAYIKCTNGVPEEKLCPDGLFYNDKQTPNGSCAFLPYKTCEAPRTGQQPPNPSKDCPRQFGFYRIGGPAECRQYKNCAHGVASITTCPEGLAFNKDTYRCDWPDQAADCDVEEYLGFTCPVIDTSIKSESEEDEIADAEVEEVPLRHYRNPKSCRRYFVCVEGKPRLYNCGKNLAFNERTKACDSYANVPECQKKVKKVVRPGLDRPTLSPEIQAEKERLLSLYPKNSQ